MKGAAAFLALLAMSCSGKAEAITLSIATVQKAYEEAYVRDQQRAESISGNPGVPFYPTRFSKARCNRANETSYDCTFRVKLPLGGEWREERASFSKQQDGTWVLTHRNNEEQD